jgi:hypothetical protein
LTFFEAALVAAQLAGIAGLDQTTGRTARALRAQGRAVRRAFTGGQIIPTRLCFIAGSWCCIRARRFAGLASRRPADGGGAIDTELWSSAVGLIEPPGGAPRVDSHADLKRAVATTRRPRLAGDVTAAQPIAAGPDAAAFALVGSEPLRLDLDVSEELGAGARQGTREQRAEHRLQEARGAST